MVLCVASLKLHIFRFLCYWTYLSCILVHLLPAVESGKSLVNVCKSLYTLRLFLAIWLLNCLFFYLFLEYQVLIENKTSGHDEVNKDLRKDSAKDWLLNWGNAETRYQRQNEVPVWIKYWFIYLICSLWHMSKVYGSEWNDILTILFLMLIPYHFNCSIIRPAACST